jgi:peptide/nickel transport system substrate-binding protein
MLGIVLGLSLLAAACGGGDDSSGDDGGSGDPGEPQMGGEVVFGVEAANSGGLCLPEAQLAISGLQMAQAVYEPLTRANADGEYVPYLAESVEPNDDYTVWTITLREGVKFHDGTEMNAEVVKNNLDAFRGVYPTRKPQLFIFVLENIADVKTTGEMSLEVTTKTPHPAFPAYLNAGNRFGVMGQAQLDDTETCATNLIGTGPFEVAEWNPDGDFVATKFADYWQSDEDGNRYPYLDKVTIRPTVDPSSRSNALLTGETQIMHTSSAIQLDTLEAEGGDDVRIYTPREYTETTYGMFNVTQPPFDSKTARQAVAYAFDPENYNEVIGLDRFEMASGPFSPGSMGYLEDAGFPTYDPDKAKELVEQYESESGEDFAFTLTMTNDAENLSTAQLVKAEAEKVGISVEIEPIEQAALINHVLGGDWQAVGWRNHGGSEPDLQYVWWKSGSAVNIGRFSDPEIDRLLDEGRTQSDPAVRQKAYEDINRRFGSEVYNLWFNWTLWSYAMNGVQGELGPNLPNGDAPFTAVLAGTPLTSMWLEQ